ncbi:precorrin-2 dehydrogenase/sirohydrochlorin ferrochelatase family protein [Halalkalicoccus jeotgali]|uniref:precorrin-2 dehydrogenase n=1 Tax=Halalkalicoccus jeotgali (strain DSM 18796 / CECT 7217 / JCM 14584 / KCTC 4019 / B3) TaxID=795797 RepID=D8JA92_HALJB|nr:bifunctional precorrin-2 dehydrogenase/sirohydrochlorin ferrochelatase [Halalkalicoccus jeotgali]ADJ14614.1 siroheme synthase [Halalkalicoccus jeotgali B3]ELY39987.1 siroheme synthase [Halalkalicoccus jeotgali B3]
MIPLLHDFEGQTVLIFGGGSVGARKARRFSREARVVVVSPAFSGAFDGSELVRAAPTPADVPEWFERADPALVVAATDDEELNEAVEREARERGVLVNRADTHGSREPGSVVVPATVREGGVVVSISTGGRSPALSRELRKRIEPELAGAGEMAELTAELREELADLSPERRREALRAVVSSSAVWKDLRTGDTNRPQVVADVIDRVESEGRSP